MATIILTSIQIIAILILARTIQENKIEMKKKDIPYEVIKTINQRTIIIFLLIEILIIAVLSNYQNISDILNQVLSQQ